MSISDFIAEHRKTINDSLDALEAALAGLVPGAAPIMAVAHEVQAAVLETSNPAPAPAVAPTQAPPAVDSVPLAGSVPPSAAAGGATPSDTWVVKSPQGVELHRAALPDCEAWAAKNCPHGFAIEPVV